MRRIDCEEGGPVTPCAVCTKYFNTKKRFFKHLHCGDHWREPKFVSRRFYELGIERPRKKRRNSFGNQVTGQPLSRRIKV
jgi:hypothetical protein